MGEAERRRVMRRSPLPPRKAPLRTRTPLARTGPPERRTPIKAVNPERRAKAWQQAFHSEAFLAHVYSFDCIVPQCTSREIEACHAVSRGAGGTWRDVFPACSTHHEIQHFNGIATFERTFGVSCRDAADRVHERWLRIGGSPTVED